MPRLTILLALTVAAAMTPAVSSDGQPTGRDSLSFEVGAVTEHVLSGSDSGLHYAVYLPSAFNVESPHPVIFLMDPRGRALVPIELFKEVADRLGYVLMSSYDTLSDADSAYAMNDRALSTMLVDAQVRFRIDPARLYLAGFSGTAHYAWDTAASLDGYVAGIFGSGDGLAMDLIEAAGVLKMRRPPAYFGAAGTGDFNFDGARSRDLALDDTSIPHRFATFEGDHSWPPQHVAADAVLWFHLNAMRQGLTALDSTFVDSLFTVDMTRAHSLQQRGQLAAAHRQYREINADYAGLQDLSEVKREIGLLALNPGLRRQVGQQSDLTRRFTLYTLRMHEVANAQRKTDDPIPLARALRVLQIDELTAKASESQDSEESAAARRMLAAAFVRFSFYEARHYFEERDYARAASVLRVAQSIRPQSPHNCLRLARAEAQLGNIKQALDAIECAVQGGLDRRMIQEDALLDPIREDPGFEVQLAR